MFHYNYHKLIAREDYFSVREIVILVVQYSGRKWRPNINGIDGVLWLNKICIDAI